MPRQVAPAILSGLLLALPFADARFAVLSWFGFLPFFSVLKTAFGFRAFFLSFLAGFTFWLLSIYWLVHVTLTGMLILVAYLSLYFGIFGFIAAPFLKNKRHLFTIPCLWVLLEYTRAHLFTGFGWALLGYSQYRSLVPIQVSDLTGVWGVSFTVILFNLGLSCRKKHLVAALLILACVTGYGLFRISHPVHPGRDLRVGVVQVNVPEELKLDPNSRDYIVDTHLRFTEQAVKESPDLVIWPEAALPFVMEEEPDVFSRIRYFVRKAGRPLLTGIVTSRDRSYYNSAVLLGGDGGVIGRYDKVHLVPFGEYVPLRKLLPFLNAIVPIGEVTRGNDYTVFTLPTGKAPVQFAVLVCFEDLFPEISRAFLARGAGFLVNITNDSWYKISPAGSQHLQASVFRAVENRVSLVRSANGGVSAFVSPEGRIRYLAHGLANPSIAQGYCVAGVRALESFSFYSRRGDWFVAVCLAVFLLEAVLALSGRRAGDV